MDLDELLSLGQLTEAQVFELLDEYSVYVHYLGFPVELRKAYSSPFRTDEKPSFGIFERTKGRASILEYKWKDSALNVSGDVVDLVKRLYGLPTREATLRQLDQEFELGLTTHQQPKSQLHVYQKPEPKKAAQIRVSTIPFSPSALAYWGSYGITQQLLTRFQVKQISGYWTQPKQDSPYSPGGLGFCYEINGYYKIYQPFNKECKFLNNYPENYVEGYLQLPERGELLLLTKSTKDVMVLRALGFLAVAPRSESTPFPAHLLATLHTRFSRILVFFDNDQDKEQNWGQLNAAKYNLPNIYIPDKWGHKDISDFYKAEGKQTTQQLLKELLHET